MPEKWDSLLEGGPLLDVIPTDGSLDGRSVDGVETALDASPLPHMPDRWSDTALPLAAPAPDRRLFETGPDGTGPPITLLFLLHFVATSLQVWEENRVSTFRWKPSEEDARWLFRRANLTEEQAAFAWVFEGNVPYLLEQLLMVDVVVVDDDERKHVQRYCRCRPFLIYLRAWAMGVGNGGGGGPSLWQRRVLAMLLDHLVLGPPTGVCSPEGDSQGIRRGMPGSWRATARDKLYEMRE